ncbi:MAG: DUF1329 domain-containing protein [Caldimonas sp.]
MKLQHIALACVLAFNAACAIAGVSAEEAAKLKSDLMPLGGEKAGNKDGSIPAWTGGYTTPIPGDKPGGRRGDPFKGEKPLFSITAQNADQYAGKLTDGTKALLKKYPEFRVDVYKTHRTAAAPQWVYDNTFKNATKGRLEGDLPKDVYGGIPFPIPKAGGEVIWNHLLRWRGSDWSVPGTQYLFTADGRTVMTTDGESDRQSPYYFEGGSIADVQKRGNLYWRIRLVNSGPPIRAGEAIVGGTAIDFDDKAWVYLTGQRRVRKLPNPCCDTPSPSTAGNMMFDELNVFGSRIDRFDWKLLGKQEIFIPYNGNGVLQPKTDAEVLGKAFIKPEYMRWELHRVWVVDANLRAGQRHQAPHSRYYCDEDTWLCVLADRWDANGQLWRTLYSMNIVAPDIPATTDGAFGMMDLLSGQAHVADLYTGKAAQFPLKPRFPDNVFSPEAMAGESVR